MAKSNREKQIMIGAGVALVALALNFIVYEPYMGALESIEKQRTAAAEKKNKGAESLLKQAQLRKALAKLKANGLKDDASQADSQVFDVVQNSAEASRLSLTSFKSDKTTDGGNFKEMDYSVAGTGSTAQLSRMLWAFETAPVPLRVKELVITSRRDAADDLQVTMKIATLASNPEAKPPVVNTNSAAPAGGVQ